MKRGWILPIVLLSIALLIAVFFLGRGSVRTSFATVTYKPLPTVSVSQGESELTPIIAEKPDSIVYIVRYRDRPANDESAPPECQPEPVIDTLASLLATVEDWNTRRVYADTLINSDTLGRATYRATVQRNKLVGFDFDYEPRQKSVVTVVPPKNRLQPYALANATTQAAELGAGVKYGRIGVHVVGGYDYRSEKMVFGGGILVVF